MSGVDNFPDGVAVDAAGMIPNIPAPEPHVVYWRGFFVGWLPERLSADHLD
jgi:hypothetical protein